MDVGIEPVRVGLRIDVDTLRGTRDGVPALLNLLATYSIVASFFFSVGPDNMGRNLWRLVRPGFLRKMLRSKAGSLYGWEIILRGTVWPGPQIAKTCGRIMKDTAAGGHEVGLHAWDHYRWQTHLHKFQSAEIRAELARGMLALQIATGREPTCSAAAAWQCNDSVLWEKAEYRLRYNSDCRGRSVFRPVVNGRSLTPQVPVTLPTYDELVGRNGVTDENYNAKILDAINPGQLNVLTIHAEVEGIARKSLFRAFLVAAQQRNFQFVPLGTLLPDGEIPEGRILQQEVGGRDGTLCVQSER